MVTSSASTVATPTTPALHTAEPRRRPRDRKLQILKAAARLFWTAGYHQVGMVDIASAVGIVPSSLYRHYRGKQELLVAVLNEALDHLDETAAEGEGLDLLVARIAACVLQRREFGALWDREQGHLSELDRGAITARLRSVVARTADLVAAERTHDAAGVVDLRARAVVAVLESPSYHRVELETAQFEVLLCRAAQAVVAATVVTGGASPNAGARPGRDPRPPASRREALLAAAVRLFAERGYPAVSLADIGAATGITGPSVYYYFPSKHDLLTSALNRGTEVLWLALHHALTGADGPLDALHRTLDSYVVFAVANPDIVSVMLAETVHLPAGQHEHYRKTQQEYVAEWVVLLRRARPHLGDAEARILVNGALALPNTLARVQRLRGRDSLAAEITVLGRAVLQAQPD